MGRKLNLSHLTEEECEQILGVLQKDFQIRRAEKKRVNTVHNELVKEQNRIAVLKENPKFNDTSCIVCLERFGIFLRRKRKCVKCELNVCPSCCSEVLRGGRKGHVCTVCSKEKAYRLLSNEWLQGKAGKGSSKKYGTAKVVRSLYKRFSSSFSDTELDSGYPPSSVGSAPLAKPRPRLDEVFDLKDGNSDEEEELPASSPKTPVLSKPIARATSLDTLVTSPERGPLNARPDPVTSLPPRPVSVTPAGTQTSGQTPEVVKRARTPDQPPAARPRSQDLDAQRNKKKKGKDTHGLYKEALEGAKRSEEFKFRVKFDQLLGDLHLAIEEKTPNGLPNSFASPSYGEVMLTFRDKVKDILKGFSQRLVLAYDSFGTLDNPEQVALQVKQDISRFIEDLIGESLDLTSDEAVSDLSSLSDDSAVDQNSFEDLIAQAVVSKLLENHRKEVSNSLLGERNRSSSALSLNDSHVPNVVRLVVKDQATDPPPHLDNGSAPGSRNTGVGGDDPIDFVDSRRKGKFSRHRRRRDSVESLFSNRSELIPDFDDEDDDDEGRDYHDEDGDDDVSQGSYSDDDDNDNLRGRNARRKRHNAGRHVRKAKSLDNVSSVPHRYDHNRNLSRSSTVLNSDAIANQRHLDNNGLDENANDKGAEDDGVADVVKDFEELKEFVRRTQATARPPVEAKVLDDSQLLEVEEEQFSKTVVDHEEKTADFHSRITVLDRVLNSEPPLPDFSQFENIDFNSHEVDPDLLSMNLAIIPEETEEELEQEEEEEEVDEDGVPGRWRANWIFKGKGVSPYENVGKKKKMMVDATQPLYMTVPSADENWAPWRDTEAHSDNADSDDLLDGSDLEKSEDDESSFYPNTSRELARISGSRQRGEGRRRSSSLGEDLQEGSDEDAGVTSHRLSKDDDGDDQLEDIPGPIIEPAKPELKLLTDLVPAENDDPKFLVPPESVTIQEGEPVKFSCQVSGTPPVDVFWYREGDEVEELEDSEDVELSNNGDKHSAILYNISKKMAGQYMCIALSDLGKAIQYLVVNVKDNKQELKKPEFLKGLADVEVTEGQSVKFRVKVKGYPPPRISWYKDGVFMRSSKACRIEKFGNRDYILTIDYATMDDDAEYTVSARNVAGEAKSSAQVLVEPQSELPNKKQKLPLSSHTSLLDSESLRGRKSLEAALTAAGIATPSYASPSSPAIRKQQERQQITQLDRKLSMTQKRVEEEANKMQVDTEKLTTINCTLDAVDVRLDTLETSLPSFPSLSDPRSKGQGRPGVAQAQERMLTSSILDMLHTAEETLQHEKEIPSPKVPPASTHSFTEPASPPPADNCKDEVDSKFVANDSSPPTTPSKKEEILGDLGLPDTLDDFPMPGLQPKAPTPGKSTLNLTIQGSRHDPTIDDDFVLQKRRPEKFTSEVNLKNFAGQNASQSESISDTKLLTPEAPDQDISFDSGKDVSISLASSVSSEASLKELNDDVIGDPVKQHSLRKGMYSRDYEISKAPETKKWSVTLDPFSPKAEIVNRPCGTNEKPGLEIAITDLSPLSSQQSSKGDNSGQSSPRQSVDSGIYVHQPKERPAPVHMVGDTSEQEVPESRTEFNVEDSSIELPSVNRLRAMFSSGAPSSGSSARDDLGDGSFKRRSYADPNDNVHSITARSVPKQQLEKLRAMNQTNPSSSSSSSPHLQVPGTASKSSATLQLSSSSSPSSSSSLSSSSPSSSSPHASKVSVKTLSNQPSPAPRHQKSSSSSRNSRNATKELYEVVDPGKEPVLIYPAAEPTDLQQHTFHQVSHNKPNGPATNGTLHPKTIRAPEPPTPGRESTTQPPSPSSPTSSTSAPPTKPPRAQPRLIVRRASETDDSPRGTPRIKSGCISARAAFWERKIVDGGEVDTEEFPEMVEEGEV